MSLESRVAALESSARRWKLGCVAALVVALSAGADDGKVATFDVVRARTLTLVNNDGEYCGFIGTRSEPQFKNKPTIALFSGNDSTIIMAGTRPFGELGGKSWD